MTRMVTCPRCGEQVKEGSKFCLRCGAPLEMMPGGTLPVPGPSMPAPPAQRKWVRNSIIIGLVALLVIGGAVAGILVWQNSSKHSVSYLIKQLDSQNAAAREKAAFELGEKGDPTAIPALVDTLQTDSDQDVLFTAADALALIDGTEGATALAELLVDPNCGVFAASSLASLSTDSSLDAMSTVLEDLDPDTLETYMMDIPGAMRAALSPEMEDWMIDNIDAKNANLRMFSVGVLAETDSRIAWEALIDALSGPYVVEVQSALTYSPNIQTDVLIAALKNPNTGAPWAVADILEKDSDVTASGDSTAAVLAFIQSRTVAEIAANYPLIIGWGVPGSEPSLIAALEATGDLAMGEAFLNSGNQTLDDAATDWGARNGYVVVDTGVAPTGPTWGSS